MIDCVSAQGRDGASGVNNFLRHHIYGVKLHLKVSAVLVPVCLQWAVLSHFSYAGVAHVKVYWAARAPLTLGTLPNSTKRCPGTQRGTLEA
ncbi:MAG: hypothetical protein AVDCRST_MAG86-3819 [uncultured Truepera sp.]|uniref:Uncharacterized protein n=1 Tax=uncultured Truepera sp. TaxID=543023 RepID=A0A6J4VUX0_9DEIN|nr:MAG: hypothetical protein AVDCRST_MAG86-3819 [uncultured Truepera sp.]